TPAGTNARSIEMSGWNAIRPRVAVSTAAACLERGGSRPVGQDPQVLVPAMAPQCPEGACRRLSHEAADRFAPGHRHVGLVPEPAEPVLVGAQGDVDGLEGD